MSVNSPPSTASSFTRRLSPFTLSTFTRRLSLASSVSPGFLSKLLHRKSVASYETPPDLDMLSLASSGHTHLALDLGDTSSETLEEAPKTQSRHTLCPVKFMCTSVSQTKPAEPAAEPAPLSLQPNQGACDSYSLNRLLVQPKYLRPHRHHKRTADCLRKLYLAQELAAGSPDDADIGAARATYCMKFSGDGKYLAAAGHDGVLRVWKIISSPIDRLEYERRYYTAADESQTYSPVFHDTPHRVFRGHTQEILTLEWSKNNFLLSGSMDGTAVLWHVDRLVPLHTFKHDDFVTSVAFHPLDDRFFLSGSLDKKLRLWSILEREVAYECDLGCLITAIAFTGDGEYCLAGGFNGCCYFVETKGLGVIAHTAVAKAKNGASAKITGIVCYKGEPEARNAHDKSSSVSDTSSGVPARAATDSSISSSSTRAAASTRASTLTSTRASIASPDAAGTTAHLYALITTNDSRIKILDLVTKTIVSEFRGLTNTSSQIMATISDDRRYVLSGSEDHWVYVWENKPNANVPLEYTYDNPEYEAPAAGEGGHSLMSRWKRHLLARRASARAHSRESTAFHAHQDPVTAAVFAPPSTLAALRLSNDPIYDLTLKNAEYCVVLGLSLLSGVVVAPPGCKLPGMTVTDHLYDPRESPTAGSDMIIVSADTRGIIRVFRQDVAYFARRHLCEVKLASLKPASLKPARSRSNSLTARLGRNLSSESLSLKKNIRGSDKALASMDLRMSENRRKPLELLTPDYDLSHRKIMFAHDDNDSLASSESASKEANNLQCAACHGLKFEVRKLAGSLGFVCMHCGTAAAGY
ncbi:hypothetical protein BABINDRAFT_160608 [Babjeviella inositovora NRRL Y-12698]|uniref:Uncharacterized protein n=1 Tax=Babjeviella inositovora NRRL Y-12698 TaxID=984486 RepID=A0A1E3QU75_9ASCO|nr:uncharacterized protein BABINDRAFT_160608 [Babjeviella inositovora NRRL Y-12698]ODQ81226.1 hypothetical protein BABINDRAFT_160608 [Babjeviella inositovora NRRL Y-12698]